MKIIFALLLASLTSFAGDRVYTADEVSNTVTVIDPKENKVVGFISLGGSHPQHRSYYLNPAQMNVHGVDVAKTKKILAVTSNLSNSVVIVDTETAKPFKLLTVGRSPHVSQFNPDESELWVCVRGESNIEIYDTKTWELKTKMETDRGPSTVTFLNSKPYVFIVNVSSKNLQVFDYHTKKLVKSIPTQGIFNSSLQKSPDEKEIWIIEKDKGLVGRIDTDKLTVVEEMEVGHYPQHVAFTKLEDGTQYGYVSVGQDQKVLVYKLTDHKAELFKTIQIDGVPHAVISVYDSKLFVNTEYGDQVLVFDIKNDFKKIATMKIGQSPQAMTFLKDATVAVKAEEDLKPANWIDEKHKTIVLNSKYNLSVISYRELQVVDMIRLHMTGTKKMELVTAYRSHNFARKNKVVEIGDAQVIAKAVCFEGSCIAETVVPKSDKNFNYVEDKSEYIVVEDKTKKVVAASNIENVELQSN